MSIWYDGTNLNMYRGDSGSIIFRNLPCCIGYRVYFSVKSEASNDIIFECAGDPEYYYIDNEGVEYEKNESETEEEFIQRMEQLVESGEAIKKGKCRIYIQSEKTEKLFLLKGESQRKYYYGLKICFASTGVENTLIPQTVRDEETGEIIFKNPPELIVRPKYVEGIMPYSDYDEIEVARVNPADYGLQPLITPVLPLKWGEDYELKFDAKTQEVLIENVKLKDDVDELKSTVGNQDKGLVHDVINVSAQVASYSSTITLLQENLTEMQGQVATMSDTVDTVTTDVADALADVDEMKETVTELSSRVASNTSNISVLQVTVADSVETVTNMKVAVDDMQEIVDRVDEDMFQLSTTVSDIQEDIEGLSDRIGGVDEHVGDLQDTVDGLGDMAWEDTSDWQQKLTPGTGININNNVISVSYTPAVKLSDLTDVKITGLQDNDILVYSASLHKWVNQQYTPGPGPTPGDNIDGGTPGTTSFPDTLDGGEPGTTSFPTTVDGGTPSSTY